MEQTAESSAAPAAPRPRGRVVWYSLRGVAVLAAAALVILAGEINRLRRHADAVAAIRVIGGDVGFMDDPAATGALASLRTWLRDRFGEDYLGTVDEVMFAGQGFYRTPTGLDDALREFHELRVLSLDHMLLTGNVSLACLRNCPRLEELNLAGAALAEADLRYVAELPNLRSLILTQTSIPGSQWRQLARLSKLEELWLDETSVSDQDLAQLAGLSSLKKLGLERTKITDRGLEQLANLADLEELRLDATPITDAGLAHLEHLDRLKMLSLNQTAVSHEGLQHLRNLLALQTLSVIETAVTGRAASAFCEARPDVNVIR